jgi:hypothetical protein
MQADGFLMSGENLPLWSRIWTGYRPFGYLRSSHIEAAARLALWEDFDCKSFDALCVSLLGEEIHFIDASQRNLGDVDDADSIRGAFPNAAQSHGLLCKWLLSISEELLDPRLGQDQENSQARPESVLRLDIQGQLLGRQSRDSRSFLMRASSAFTWRAGDSQQRTSAELTRSSDLQKRFAYFVDKVRPLQIWRDDRGALFLELKGIVQRLMDGVARACNERYAELVEEPCGRQLAAFCSIGVEPTRVKELLSLASSLEKEVSR